VRASPGIVYDVAVKVKLNVKSNSLVKIRGHRCLNPLLQQKFKSYAEQVVSFDESEKNKKHSKQSVLSVLRDENGALVLLSANFYLQKVKYQKLQNQLN
jgi:hypothetical protein